MAYTTINKSSSYFNTKLYTGTGSAQSLTGVGFQPDLVWTKPRSAIDNHGLYDVIRGATKNIQSHSNYAEQTSATLLTSFDSDGFSVGTNSEINGSAITYASWNWVGGGTGVSNTDGSVTSTVSANQTSGFSIVKWTASGGNDSIGHGLNAIPQVILAKNLGTTQSWRVMWLPRGADKFWNLDSTAVEASSSTVWQSTSPTTSLFYTGSAFSANDTIAYCFAEKKGFSKMGYYIGNGNVNGNFIYTGFKPACIISKNATSAENWSIFDNKRLGYNSANNRIYPNLTNAEVTETQLDFVSNGFKIRSAGDGHLNQASYPYIYMAFAEHPLVSSTGTPCTAR